VRIEAEERAPEAPGGQAVALEFAQAQGNFMVLVLGAKGGVVHVMMAVQTDLRTPSQQGMNNRPVMVE